MSKSKLTSNRMSYVRSKKLQAANNGFKISVSHTFLIPYSISCPLMISFCWTEYVSRGVSIIWSAYEKGTREHILSLSSVSLSTRKWGVQILSTPETQEFKVKLFLVPWGLQFTSLFCELYFAISPSWIQLEEWVIWVKLAFLRRKRNWIFFFFF